jgi:hypothetical protein
VSHVVWYVVAAVLGASAACSLWVAIADLRRRSLQLWPALVFLASLGALWGILPYVLPPAPPAPDANGFVLHYDIRTRTTWITPVILLLGVLSLTGAALFAAVQSYRDREWSQLVLVVVALVLILGPGWYVVVTYFRAGWELVGATERGEFDVVEGPVTDYELKRGKDNWSESFKVGGVPFHYSSGSVNFGFDRPAPRGGPISPGRYVRIAHRGNVILRLETRE